MHSQMTDFRPLHVQLTCCVLSERLCKQSLLQFTSLHFELLCLYLHISSDMLHSPEHFKKLIENCKVNGMALWREHTSAKAQQSSVIQSSLIQYWIKKIHSFVGLCIKLYWGTNLLCKLCLSIFHKLLLCIKLAHSDGFMLDITVED